MPVVSVKIGDHCYHGLCDEGASVSAIPQSLYDEIKDEIAPIEIDPIDVAIQLANRDTICLVEIVRDVEVLCGKTKYPADFLVLATAQDIFCPIIFGRPFLNTVNAHIIVRSKLSLLALKACHMSSISPSSVDNLMKRSCLVGMKLLP